LSGENLLDEGILIIDMSKLRIGSAFIADSRLGYGTKRLAAGTA
jgi:hypothetical protein